MFRVKAMIAATMLGLVAAPASAQFFLKPADLSGPRVTGAEPGMVGEALPNATPAEFDAALVWNLRAALNVAALQCQFQPTLLTVDRYNALLADHKAELDQSYKVLASYFDRVNSTPKAGQAALDQFGTRVYSGFSTVGGQLSFCAIASRVGRDAMYVAPGKLADFAKANMYELRRSLLNWGDQVSHFGVLFSDPRLPNLADTCWKDETYQPDVCGPAPVG